MGVRQMLDKMIEPYSAAQGEVGECLKVRSVQVFEQMPSSNKCLLSVCYVAKHGAVVFIN
jgi:hypothetical protein